MVISICPEALTYPRRDTPQTAMILFTRCDLAHATPDQFTNRL